MSFNVKAQEAEYDEELSITVVSNIGLWKIKEIGVNVSSLGVTSIERIANVQEFELMFTKHSEYDSRVEYFKSYGYNVLGFDILPQQGAVLRVNTSSLDTARQVAAVLENAFHLSFILISSSGNNHVFFSNAELGRPQEQKFLPINLWNLFIGKGGLDRLVTMDTFQINPMPMLALHGRKADSGFLYTIWVGGIAPQANNRGTLNFDNFFQFATGINASRTARTSTIEFKYYGGFINPQEKYNFTHIPELRASIVRSPMSPKENRSEFDFTYLRSAPNLVVTRSVDKSAMQAGDTLEYRIRFENVAPREGGIAISELSARETWWEQHFETVRAESNLTIRNLGPGESRTLVYILRARTTSQAVASTSDTDSTFRFNYTIANRPYISTVRANDVSIVLNRGAAALVAEGSATNYYPTTPGNTSAVLLIRNGGTNSAFNVRAYLGDRLVETIPSVAPDSFRPVRVSTPIPFDNFALKQRDLSWRIEWTDAGQTLSARSNVFPIFENYTSTTIPILDVQKTSIQNKTIGDGIYETRITITNNGKIATGAFEVLDFPPRGTTLSSGDFTPSGQGLSATVDNMLPNTTETLSYLSRGPTTNNIITGPAFIRFKIGDATSEVLTRSIVSPDAVTLAKTVNTQRGFIGYNFTVDLKLRNEGAEPIFNVGIDGRDTPLRVAKGDNVASKSLLASGESIDLTYSIQSFRGQNASQVGAFARFTLAGAILELSTKVIPIAIYSAPEVRMKLEENPLDNRPYRVLIEIFNSSPLPINSLLVGQGVTENFRIVEGDVDAGISRQLASGDRVTLSVTGISPEPNKLMRFAPRITHIYEGQTIVVPNTEMSSPIGEDIASKFAVPAGIGIAIVLLTWVLVRRAVQTKPEERV